MKYGIYVQEAAKLSARNDDGTYDVVIITEGTGSTGVYSGDLMRDDQAALFENAPSFMNHPIDPTKPHQRDVMSISGRFTNLRAGVSEGKKAILARFKPRKEFADFVEEFSDVLGLSIFSLANGEEKDDHGRLIVESFADEDPYRSVDIVVAAGRGGKFARAEESARAIEASLGTPGGTQPASTSAAGTDQKKESMDPKDVQAVAEALGTVILNGIKPLTDFVTEHKTAAEAAKAGKADQPDTKTVIAKAVADTAAVEALQLTSETLKTSLLDAIARGEDVAPAIEFAKKVATESAAKPAAPASEYVIEAADGKSSHSFAVTGLAR